MSLLMSLSSGNISLICNIVIFAIMIMCLISCLTGLKKGLIKSLLKLVVWIILLLIVYLNNINFTKAFYNFNITQIINWLPLNKSLMINGNEVFLTQKIGDIVSDILRAYDISASKSAVDALALSILSFFVLIINLLLCLIISPILTFILYILVVRPIFKKVMRKHKLRIGGLFVNGTKTLLVSAAFLTPLFSVTEVMLKNYNDALEDGYKYDENKANDYWKIMYPIFNGYNNSLLHYTFAVLTGRGNNINYYTVNVNNSNTKVNFAEVVGDVFAAACSTLSIAEDVSQGSLVAALLSDKTLDLITQKILNNAFLVNEVVPIASKIALNMVDENSMILSKEEANKLSEEISYINFGEDLSSFVELFRILNENGYVSESILDNKPYFLSNENYNSIKKGLNNFKIKQEAIKNSGKKTLLDVVLPPILASLVSNELDKEKDEIQNGVTVNDFVAIFPDTAEGYRQEEFDTIELLDVLVDVLFNFNGLYKEAMTLPNNLGVSSINNSQEIQDLDILKLGDINPGILLDIFYEEKIVFANNEENLSTLSLFFGNGKGGNRGLFDIPFVVNSMNKLLNIALKMLKGSLFDDKTFVEIQNKLNTIPETKESWEIEINSMLRFIAKIYNKNDFPIMLKGQNGELVINANFQVDLENEKHLSTLKDAISQMGDSIVIPSILVPIVKEKLSVDWDKIGVDYNDLNFDKFSSDTNLGNELVKLLDAFQYATPIFNLSEGENIFESGINSSDLRIIFSELVDCEIINPNKNIVAKENNVLRQIILNLFNDSSLNNVGITLSEEAYDSCEDISVEFDKICNIYAAIENDDSLNSLFEQQNITLNDINGDSFSNLIDAISESDFFRPCLSSVLEKQFKPILEESQIDASYLEFDAIDKEESIEKQKQMWKEESKNIANIIESLKQLQTDNGFNLSEVISDENNKESLNTLLSSFAKLHMVESPINQNGKEYDRLGLILYDLIKEPLKDYINNDDEAKIKEDFSFALDDKNYLYLDGTSANLSRGSKWDTEINKFCDIIFQMSSLQDENGNLNIDLTNENSIDAIKEFLIGNKETEQETAGLNDIIFLRTIFGNIIAKSINQTFNSSESTLNDLFANNENLIYTDAFENELNYEGNNFNYYLNNIVTDKTIDNSTLTKRELESELRYIEIEHIFNVINEFDSFQVENVSFDDIKLFLEPLLTNLHDSIIFHNTKLRNESSNIGKTTIFERLILIAMNKLKLADISFDAEIHKGYNNASNYMLHKVLEMSNYEQFIDESGFSNNGVLQADQTFRTWKEEITSLNDIVNCNELAEVMNNGTLNGGDYSTIDDNSLATIMNYINKSYLLHDGTIYISRTLLNHVKIDYYRIDENEIATQINYNLDKDKIYFADKISVWSDEINNITKLKTALSYSDVDNNNHIIDFENYDFSSSNLVKIEKILPALKDSKIIEPMFYDFLYKTMDSSNISQYISCIADAPNKIQGYDEQYDGDINQVAKKKRDTIKYLCLEKIEPRQEKLNAEENTWAYEGKFLDDALTKVSSNINITMTGDLSREEIDNIVDLYSLVYQYNGNAYNYLNEADEANNIIAEQDMINEDKYIRGYLISEVMFNLFNEKAHDLDINYLDIYAYKYVFNCFNDYEKEAIKTILNLHNDFTTLYNFSDAQNLLKPELYRNLGPGKSENSAPRDNQHILLEDGINARFACELLNNNYIENAIYESSFGQKLIENQVDIKGLFTVNENGTNYSIEYHVENVWLPKLTQILLQHPTLFM